MSAAVYSQSNGHEPYRVQAGILAAIVHGAFFALLYFGFTWQTLPPAIMNVELWRPEDMIAPAAAKPPPPPPPPKKVVVPNVKPVKPEKVIAPEIKIPDKKKIEPKPVDQEAEKRKAALKSAKEKKIKQERIAKEKAAKEQAERERVERERERVAREQAAREQAARAQADRERAEQEAAIGKIVDEYIAKINAKIRRNIVMPANVADEAFAEFSVTLLPGGDVLQPKLLRASGNELYDSAVERAILKSAPLPLPPDVKLFNRFRNLKLSFRPVE